MAGRREWLLMSDLLASGLGFCWALMSWSCMMMQVLGGLPKDVPEAPEVPRVQGKELQRGPQMLQLS